MPPALGPTALDMGGSFPMLGGAPPPAPPPLEDGGDPAFLGKLQAFAGSLGGTAPAPARTPKLALRAAPAVTVADPEQLDEEAEEEAGSEDEAGGDGEDGNSE